MGNKMQEKVDSLFHEIHNALFADQLKNRIERCKNESASEDNGEFGYYINFKKDNAWITLKYDEDLKEFAFTASKKIANSAGFYCQEIADDVTKKLEDLNNDSEPGFCSIDNGEFGEIFTCSIIEKNINVSDFSRKHLNKLLACIMNACEGLDVYENELEKHIKSAKENFYDYISETFDNITKKLTNEAKFKHLFDKNVNINISFEDITSSFYQIPFKDDKRFIVIDLFNKELSRICLIDERYNMTKKNFQALANPYLLNQEGFKLEMEGGKGEGYYAIKKEYYDFDEEESIKYYNNGGLMNDISSLLEIYINIRQAAENGDGEAGKEAAVPIPASFNDFGNFCKLLDENLSAGLFKNSLNPSGGGRCCEWSKDGSKSIIYNIPLAGPISNFQIQYHYDYNELKFSFFADRYGITQSETKDLWSESYFEKYNGADCEDDDFSRFTINMSGRKNDSLYWITYRPQGEIEPDQFSHADIGKIAGIITLFYDKFVRFNNILRKESGQKPLDCLPELPADRALRKCRLKLNSAPNDTSHLKNALPNSPEPSSDSQKTDDKGIIDAASGEQPKAGPQPQEAVAHKPEKPETGEALKASFNSACKNIFEILLQSDKFNEMVTDNKISLLHAGNETVIVSESILDGRINNLLISYKIGSQTLETALRVCLDFDALDVGRLERLSNKMGKKGGFEYSLDEDDNTLKLFCCHAVPQDELARHDLRSAGSKLLEIHDGMKVIIDNI